MRRAFLVMFLLLTITSATFAQQSYVAVNEDTSVAVDATTSVSVSPITTQERVQIKNSYDYWRSGDEVVIANYLAKHKAKLNSENYNVLRVGLRQIVGSGKVDARDSRGRLILDQSTQHYIILIQGLYELRGLRLYVNHTEQPQAPIQKLELPAFNGGSIPDLGLQECQPIEKPRERAAAPCEVPQGPTGAVAIFHPGDRQESAIAYGSKSWTKIPQPKCITEPLPVPVVGPCPPGPPATKPPTSAPVGNPTYKEPVGAPAAGGPPTPTGAQTPVKIGNSSVTWGPTPTHPKVAGSVTP